VQLVQLVLPAKPAQLVQQDLPVKLDQVDQPAQPALLVSMAKMEFWELLEQLVTLVQQDRSVQQAPLEQLVLWVPTAKTEFWEQPEQLDAKVPTVFKASLETPVQPGVPDLMEPTADPERHSLVQQAVLV
jgi:hypothetical protein